MEIWKHGQLDDSDDTPLSIEKTKQLVLEVASSSLAEVGGRHNLSKNQLAQVEALDAITRIGIVWRTTDIEGEEQFAQALDKVMTIVSELTNEAYIFFIAMLTHSATKENGR